MCESVCGIGTKYRDICDESAEFEAIKRRKCDWIQKQSDTHPSHMENVAKSMNSALGSVRGSESVCGNYRAASNCSASERMRRASAMEADLRIAFGSASGPSVAKV